jgi:hypothetical protein
MKEYRQLHRRVQNKMQIHHLETLIYFRSATIDDEIDDSE